MHWNYGRVNRGQTHFDQLPTGAKVTELQDSRMALDSNAEKVTELGFDYPSNRIPTTIEAIRKFGTP